MYAVRRKLSRRFPIPTVRRSCPVQQFARVLLHVRVVDHAFVGERDQPREFIERFIRARRGVERSSDVDASPIALVYTKLGEEKKTLERDASNLTHPRTRASRARDNRHHGANGASMIDRVVASSRVVSRRPARRTYGRTRPRTSVFLSRRCGSIDR